MCEIHELVRAFILQPDMLYKSGVLLKDMIFDFQSLQKGYAGGLDIFFLRDFAEKGGFAVCFPPDFSREEIDDATPYLIETLGVSPRLIDLSKFI